MAQKKWQVSKVRYCEHVGQDVALEVPADQIPDQPPHVTAHRCSKAMECNKIDKMVCAYCFTNPNENPV